MRQERVGLGRKVSGRGRKGGKKGMKGKQTARQLIAWFSSRTKLAKVVTMRESDKLLGNWTQFSWKQSSSTWTVIRINESLSVNNHFVSVIPYYQMLTREPRWFPRIPQMMWYSILPLWALLYTHARFSTEYKNNSWGHWSWLYP